MERLREDDVSRFDERRRSRRLAAAWLALPLLLATAASSRAGDKYRPCGTAAQERTAIGLVVRTAAAGAFVKVVQVDGEALGGMLDGGYPSTTDYFELPAGHHTLNLILHQNTGGPYYRLSGIKISAELEAGHEYVLWGTIEGLGKQGQAKAGISRIEDFGVDDWLERVQLTTDPKVHDRRREGLDKERTRLQTQLTEFWAGKRVRMKLAGLGDSPLGPVTRHCEP
jgi:hypothetical protein